MLTSLDFQRISEILDQKLSPIHGELGQHSVLLKQHGSQLEEIQDKLALHEQMLKQHGTQLEQIQKKLTHHDKLLAQHSRLLTNHSKSLKSLKNDQNVMIEMLDKEQMDQRKRLDTIESKLKLSSVIL